MTANKFPSHDVYSGIHLFSETTVDLPLDKKKICSITSSIEKEETCTFALVEIVFVDEAEIIKINNEHLSRNYVTDIISFRYDENSGSQAIEGTLYCCAPRILEQAAELSEPAHKELKRIVIHGLLHLVGYDDQSKDEKKAMRAKEDFFLEMIE